MAAPLAAIPWLLRGALPWLMRGKGINLPLRKTAEGVTKTIRGAQPGYSARYTPVKPNISSRAKFRPHGASRPGYQEDLYPRIQMGGADQFRGVPGATVSRLGGKSTVTYPPTPPVTSALKPGFARRHPFITAGTGASVLGTGYGMMAGDDEPMVAPAQAYAPEAPWSAPSDMLNFADQQELLAEEGKEELSRMLKFGFGLAAAGAKTDKFFERGMAIMEQSRAYKESKHFADVVRAVYKDGDMPKNARIAYERLTPLVGPEQAAVLSGHQLGMEEGKTKEERIWNKIMDIAQYDIDGAAAELVAAWGTGMLKNPPVQPQNEIRLAKAREMIAQLMGGTGLAAGVQNLERVDA